VTPEDAALAALDPRAIAADAAVLVRAPSPTGEERPALELFAELARERAGLQVELVAHDLAALRASAAHPGEEAARTELLGLTATLPAAGPGAPRLCLNGHVDTVGPGEAPWSRPPLSGAIDGGFVHGRGSADMKGGLVAALHAVAAVARTAGAAPADVVLQAVASEEDGGLGTVAALERDDRFDAALIPEPTGFQVACVQAGALTFRGTVPGVSAHAAVRLEGVSALDRYVVIHAALQEHERALNADVRHPLMRALRLPYPLLVGRLEAGRWSSQVPDRAVFEGRVGVRVEQDPAAARATLESVVRAACPEAELTWEGGQFAPGATDPDHPFCRLVQAAGADELGAAPELVGVPYGSDMRLFAARGIPCVMVGPGGLERAHGVDERVRVEDLHRTARLIVRVLSRYGAGRAATPDRPAGTGA
jgi:acetylornithine deacetylase